MDVMLLDKLQNSFPETFGILNPFSECLCVLLMKNSAPTLSCKSFHWPEESEIVEGLRIVCLFVIPVSSLHFVFSGLIFQNELHARTLSLLT